MRIELLSNEVFNFNCLFLEDKPIGIFQGLFFISKKEREHVIQIANMIWRKILKKAGVKNFVGYIRFDFVPKIKKVSKIEKRVLEVDFEISGIYEINVHSPECASVIAALHRVLPQLRFLQANPAYLISEAIKKTFKKTIIFVPGNGKVKRNFSGYFFDELSKFLDIKWMSEEEAMKWVRFENKVLWRWGDARINGSSEYSNRFLRFLLELQSSKRIIFNSVPRSVYEDLGNKIYLIPESEKGKVWEKLVGKNFLLNSKNLRFALKEREKLVLKPLLGSSGNGIVFGKKVSQDRWERILKEKLHHKEKFGLFEARWLPSIEIDEKNKIVFDFNSTFWAVNEELNYLYSVIRVDDVERYSKRLVINVTQGGGFAGVCCEEE